MNILDIDLRRDPPQYGFSDEHYTELDYFCDKTQINHYQVLRMKRRLQTMPDWNPEDSMQPVIRCMEKVLAEASLVNKELVKMICWLKKESDKRRERKNKIDKAKEEDS